MQLYVGTSGYSYKEWKGTFYPEKLSGDDMLGYYAQRFSTVEINNTYYRMPSLGVVQSWAEQVPPTFRFAIKAHQVITHRKRLKDVEEATELFLTTAAVLKERQGPVLFGLPPNFKKDVVRLNDFLGLLGGRVQAAFEFRHESWFDDETYDCLRAHSCALCVADAEDLPEIDLVRTAPWGYVRLRREGYTDEQLRAWIKKLTAQGWDEAYVYFKHEDTGTGPELAARFLELAGAAKPSRT